MFFRSHGEPLFSSHSLDLSEESRTENVGTCATYLKKMAPLNLILEMEISIVENGGPGKFYSTPEDVWTIWEALAPISQKFTISAAFKNVNGVCKPGNAKLSPGLLNNFQVFAAAKVGQPQPYFFSCHGGSGSEKHVIDAALRFGVVKINVASDTQWAYCDPQESELTMVALVKEACVDLKNTNGQPSNETSKAAVGAGMTEIMAELKETATKLCAPGKGFLAADESAGPWLRAGHADAAKIPDTLENRAAYRSMCFSTPGLSEHISGVILHWETLFQADANGKDMVKIITENGMIPGIKVDKGYNKKGIWSTEVGPLKHPETACKGLDDLQERAAQAYAQGARFAKWRNVLQLDPAKGLPSDISIIESVHTLARYASICQSERLVPIVEPEIVPNGDHDIEYCAKMTKKVLLAQFQALKHHNVYLEGAVLKPNMVKPGLKGPKASHELIATLTVQTLLDTVPPSMPGIFFLSGEAALDEDNEEAATINLSKMNELFKGKTPWHVSFSYGKALQKTCIVTWLGKAENAAAAQKALKARAGANSDAVFGQYKAGTCATVGTDGNINQAAGPY